MAVASNTTLGVVDSDPRKLDARLREAFSDSASNEEFEAPFAKDSDLKTALDFRSQSSRAGLILAIATLAFIGLGALLPLHRSVAVTGAVSIEGHARAVQHQTGGTIATVSVQDGDEVTRGQVLMTLDVASRSRSLEAIAQRTMLLSHKAERLRAEIDGRTTLEPGAVADYRDVIGFDTAGRLTMSQLAGRLDVQESEQEELASARVGTAARLSRLAAGRADLRTTLSLANVELARLEAGYEAGVISANAVDAVRRQRLDARVRLRDMEDRHDQAAQALMDLDLKADGLAARLDEERSRAMLETMGLLAEAKRDHAELSAALDDATIRAGADGIVQNLADMTVGRVIAPGQTLANIVPASARLVVDTRVRPADIGAVVPGAEAELRLSAFQGRNAPTFTGHVEMVSPDLYYPAERGQPGAYLARIRLDDTLQNDLPERLRPGMEATATIAAGSRSILDYLISPVSDAMRGALSER